MKKKLSSLLLAIAMLAGMSSCGDGSVGIDTSADVEYNMTLTLWLPTSEDTTDESVALVEEAINKITKKNYKTAIDITAVPEDEYDEAIKQKVLDVEEAAKRTAEEEAERKRKEKEAKKKGETLASETVTTVPSTIVDKDGNVQEYYPEVKADQLDIFCIRGYDNFAYFAENGYLSPLNENLDASAKLLKSYIHPTFLEWATLTGDASTYAIPNNHIIGDYTYMLVNNEMCDALKYDPSEFSTLDDAECRQFIEDIGETQTGITPLLDDYFLPGLNFWNPDGNIDTFSVIASMVSDNDDPTDRCNLRNVFGLKQFRSALIMVKELKEKGYVGNGADPKTSNFGVGIVQCDSTEIGDYNAIDYATYKKAIEEGKKPYELAKYTAVPIQVPRAYTDDVYQSMFAVSLNTLDVKRSMDIVTAINTDPTIRTILQYGVQGIHWDYNDELTADGEQTIKFLDKHSEYKMDIINTGNVFMTYPDENIPMSYWDKGRQQNLDSLISPFLGFHHVEKVLSDDEIPKKNGKPDPKAVEENEARKEYMEIYNELAKYSKEIWAEVDAMSAAEFEETFKDIQDKVSDSDPYIEITDPEYLDSLIARYLAFYAAVHEPEPVM